jgi:uncharacterized membrane protein (DUF373 family)
MWKEEALDYKLTRFYEASARTLLSLLIITIFLAILAGTGYTLYDIRLVFSGDFHAACKTVLVDMLTVLAFIEILRTALAYFSEGRVKVTYIIDTVMVTVLTEVMAFWYKDMDWQKIGMVIALVVSLSCIRIMAVRFSPRRVRDEL